MNEFGCVLGTCGALLAACGCACAQVAFSASNIDATHSGDCKALADIDGDGKADPILAGSSLAWYEAGAAFVRREILASVVYKEFTTDMQAADVDGDGDIDLIVPDGGGPQNILWFENPRLNTPAGHSSDPRVGANWVYHIVGTQGEHVHDLEVGDLDNDGKLDIVTSGHGITRVWKQISPTTWQTADISVLAGAGVSIGDIDRDGRKDIATPSGWIKTPTNLISGTWTKYPISGTLGDECLLGDFDNDGRLDLLVCDAHMAAEVAWFQAPSNPTSALWTKRIISTSMGSHHPEAADFNRDGRLDVLLGLELTDLSIYVNQVGSPLTFAKVPLSAQAAHNARVGDLDGNGMPDVFGCDYIGHPPAFIFVNQNSPPSCYSNCDNSSVAPVLNSLDLSCFINRFFAGDSWANCDGSTVPPTLNILDFRCFLNRFVAGCS